MADVKPIPEGCRTVTPHLTINGTSDAISFYQKAFGAVERNRSVGPGGLIMHAELEIGDSLIFMNDEFPQGAKGPVALGGSPVTIHLYLEDVDAVWQQAVDAGAKVSMPLMDAFWGDRYGVLEDPFGHRWALATHKEDLSSEEIAKRAAEFFGGDQ